MKPLLPIFLITLSAVLNVNAQIKIKDGTVTPATSPLPQSGAVLELESTNKGLLVPRLTTAQRDAIVPANLTDGLMIYNTTEGCYDYYQLAAGGWIAYCGASISAYSISVPQCSAITVNGNYSPGVVLTPSNYLAVPVTVTAGGSYTMTGTTTNGYFFSASGVFPGAGSFTVNLTGTGAPTAVGTDNVTLKLNGAVSATCTPTVKVGSSYSITCGSIITHGTYLIGTPVSSSSYLSVPVNVTAIGPYTISSNTANGYSFNASGSFTAIGAQTITVPATGTPVTGETDNFTLTAAGGATPVTCGPVAINVTSKTMNIFGLGGGIYQPGTGAATESSRAILQASQNFGPTGTVKTQSINIANGGQPGVGTLSIPASTDIVVIGYSYTLNAADATTLNNFINGGGVVLAFCEDATSIALLTNAVFGTGTTITAGAADIPAGALAYDMQLTSISGDPVLNGPFGALGGQYLGMDVLGSITMQNVPASGIKYAYQTLANNKVFALRHPTKGFLIVGDGGSIAGNSTDMNTTIYPCAITASGTPIAKAVAYGGAGGPNVWNSVFYANAMAWAIGYVQTNKP